MDSRKIESTSVACEKKLLNFLKICTAILNSQNLLIDIDALSNAIKSDELTQVNLLSGKVCDAILLNNNEIKRLFLNELNMKKCLEMSVQALLDYLIEIVTNYEIEHHTIIVEYAENVSNFLNACEKSKTILSIENSVILFLKNLLLLLDNLNSEYVAIKGPINYAILKTLSAFKEINFAKKFILAQIFEFFEKIAMSGSKNKNNFIQYYNEENFGIYLVLLKDVLQYTININVKPLNQTEIKFFQSFTNILKAINKQAPEFIKMVACDCINLMT